MNIGFIGLGRMGSAIASRIVNGGHDVVVYNRTPGRAGDLLELGATEASNVAELCENRELVITMLADDAALRAVTFEAGGLLGSLGKGAIHMAMGTHGVETVVALDSAHREVGQTLVGAPVLGRPKAANEGTLGIITGGPLDAVTKCEPLFPLIGRRVFDAGVKPEGASAVKLANGLLLGCAIEVMGEAFSLVRKYGVDPETFHDVLTGGLFSAPAYKTYARIIVDEAYDDPGFTTELGLKDANLILAAASAANLPLPSANVWRDRLLGSIAHGGAQQDWAVVAREQARAGGLEP
jgi:3-hydroxyisobutyrate dehydrogenase-like beta-hydroxyacid dehydrogenase